MLFLPHLLDLNSDSWLCTLFETNLPKGNCALLKEDGFLGFLYARVYNITNDSIQINFQNMDLQYSLISTCPCINTEFKFL